MSTGVSSPLPARGVIGMWIGGRRAVGVWLGRTRRRFAALAGLYRATQEASEAILKVVSEEKSSALLLEDLEIAYRKQVRFRLRAVSLYVAIAGLGALVAIVFDEGTRGWANGLSLLVTFVTGIMIVWSVRVFWRRNLNLTCALALLGALNAGCASIRDIADAGLRDRFAKELYENLDFAARRLKACRGPGPHKRHVRGNARAFRNALMSRLPDVAAQDPEARSQLVDDLARVIVRVSNGRWDRIDDITREERSLKRSTRLARWLDVWVFDTPMKPAIMAGVLGLAGILLASLSGIVVALITQK